MVKFATLVKFKYVHDKNTRINDNIYDHILGKLQYQCHERSGKGQNYDISGVSPRIHWEPPNVTDYHKPPKDLRYFSGQCPKIRPAIKSGIGHTSNLSANKTSYSTAVKVLKPKTNQRERNYSPFGIGSSGAAGETRKVVPKVHDDMKRPHASWKSPAGIKPSRTFSP